MPERELKFSSRYVRRQFEKAVGRSVVKLLTELITNSDDSYSRIVDRLGTRAHREPAFGRIEIVLDRAQRRLAVVDQAEGMSAEEMDEKLVQYGLDTAAAGTARVRGLFGKGVRDVLFTQHVGHIKSIKDGKSAICKFRWKGKSGHEIAVVDIQEGPRVTPELRASWRIQGNGTATEFRLREDVRVPQTEKLLERLSGFYMLRLINSNAERKLQLEVVGRRGAVEIQPIVYRFPEGEKLRDINLTWKYETFRPISGTGEIWRHAQPMTQGEVGYEEREGGILVTDENDSVLDLTLFGFDEHPHARRLCGRIKLDGAGEIIRAKLNQSRPEEILTETRDGFDRKHPFYKELRSQVEAILKPIVDQEGKQLKQEEASFSEETAKKHRKAFDRLNEIYKVMVGEATPGSSVPITTLQRPEGGIAFLRSALIVTAGKATPVGLVVDVGVIPLGTEVNLSSTSEGIIVEPARFVLDPGVVREGIGLKIVRITGQAAGEVGQIRASAFGKQTEISVQVVEAEVFTPINGLEFNPDRLRLHDGQRRSLRLYIDGMRIPYGERIEVVSSNPDFVVSRGEIVFDDTINRTGEIGVAEVPIVGHGIGKRGEIIAVGGGYRASAEVEVVSKRERPESLGGRFRGFRFERLDRKVQTMPDPDGYILINADDPVNKRYFGENPTESVEKYAHCQIRVADLILDECLQIMVSEAIGAGTLERRFPDNPEIDIRNYTSEKKFEYGNEIHSFFVRPSLLRE